VESYPSYKDSGVEWIGEIPSEWDYISLKYYFDYTKGSLGQKLTKTYIDNNKGEYPVYSGMTSNDGILGHINEYEFDYPFPLIFTTTVGSKSMTTKFLNGKFSLSQNCLVMIKKNECNPLFIRYFLSYDFIFRKHLLPTIFQPSLRMEDLDTYKICLPPKETQSQITSFLDNKTQKINDLIQKTEKNIELLKEKRTSLINHYVTKGLNPNVEIKDSGVEWIGDVPSHWNITPLKFLGDFQNGISKGSEYFGSGLPFMNYGDVYNNEVTPTIVEGKVQSDEIDRNRYSVKRGDIFFTRTSESKDDIGVTSVCLTTISESVFSGFVIRYRFNKDVHIPEYSRYHFQTHWKKVFIESKMNIVTRSSLSQQVLGLLPVFILSKEEQTQIVEYLDEKTQKIDSTIEKETQRIDLLKEYRQSLISEVVTGKVDVRDYNG